MTCYQTSSKFDNFSRLVHWSPAPTLNPKILSSWPTQLKKEEKNQSFTRRAITRIIFFTDSIRNQHPKFRNRNFGFDKNFRNSYRSFGWAETGECYEVSGENELLCAICRRGWCSVNLLGKNRFINVLVNSTNFVAEFTTFSD
jgi:hypothetical protein